MPYGSNKLAQFTWLPGRESWANFASAWAKPYATFGYQQWKKKHHPPIENSHLGVYVGIPHIGGETQISNNPKHLKTTWHHATTIRVITTWMVNSTISKSQGGVRHHSWSLTFLQTKMFCVLCNYDQLCTTKNIIGSNTLNIIKHHLATFKKIVQTDIGCASKLPAVYTCL